MRHRCLQFFASAALLAAFVQPQAATVTLSGQDVDFTFDDTLVGPFGTPTVSDNTLSFAPTTFTATALNGTGAVLVNGTVNVTVTARGQDSRILRLALEERGSYIRDGETAEVAVTGELRATRLPLEEIASLQPSSNFEPTGLAVQDWEASAALDLKEWDASEVLATAQNILIVRSLAADDIAFIGKMRVDLTAFVPLPPAVWLLGSALIGLVAIGRRRLW